MRSPVPSSAIRNGARPDFPPRFHLSMDKDLERGFLEVYSKALVSLPFDVKVLLEAVSDADLEHGVRELAAAAVVHVITPKDGNVEPFIRHAEDVVLLRLALRKIAAEGGEGAEAFKARFDENYGRLDERDRRVRGGLRRRRDHLARQQVAGAAQGGLRPARRSPSSSTTRRWAPSSTTRACASGPSTRSPRSRWPVGSSRRSRSSITCCASASRTGRGSRTRSQSAACSRASSAADPDRPWPAPLSSAAPFGAGPEAILDVAVGSRARRWSLPAEITLAAREVAPAVAELPRGEAARGHRGDHHGPPPGRRGCSGCTTPACWRWCCPSWTPRWIFPRRPAAGTRTSGSTPSRWCVQAPRQAASCAGRRCCTTSARCRRGCCCPTGG